MMKHTIKEWIIATRYWSFSVSALPVVATTAYICATRGITAGGLFNVLLAVIGVVLLHAAGNMFSDVGDFRSGADSREACAVLNLVEHKFEPEEYLRFALFLLIAGIAIGLWLVCRCGRLLLVIGGPGVIFMLLYTKSKNYWLGDLNIFVIFGILIVLGTSIVVTREICFDTLLLSVPIGLITLSVLHANNTVDIETDRVAGLRTPAMAMGFDIAVKVYISYQIIPFLWIIGCVALRLLPWPTLLCLVSCIAAAGNIRQAAAYKTRGREALMGLDIRSAKLQLIFSLMLSIGLFSSILL